MSPASKIRERAKALAEVRSFFHGRNILEVDTPILSPYPSLDAFIDVIKADGGYLHTSPEYRMKELISQTRLDIYYLGHVFRKEEKGRLHNTEFTMIEYYRVGKSLDFLIEETLELISLFLPNKPIHYVSYADALSKFGKVYDNPNLSAQERRHLTWAIDVEPFLKEITVVTPFPSEESALAKFINGQAMRFEIYYNGVELANGFDELMNVEEQRSRFMQANKTRSSLDKEIYPLDESFLSALNQLPDCTGVAIGFDRLLQIKLKTDSIHEVLFSSH